jgi:hypothetical protein
LLDSSAKCCEAWGNCPREIEQKDDITLAVFGVSTSEKFNPALVFCLATALLSSVSDVDRRRHANDHLRGPAADHRDVDHAGLHEWALFYASLRADHSVSPRHRLVKVVREEWFFGNAALYALAAGRQHRLVQRHTQL